MIPTDLKDYRASAGFALFDDTEALIVLAAILALAFLADRLGWLA